MVYMRRRTRHVKNPFFVGENSDMGGTVGDFVRYRSSRTHRQLTLVCSFRLTHLITHELMAAVVNSTDAAVE